MKTLKGVSLKQTIFDRERDIYIYMHIQTYRRKEQERDVHTQSELEGISIIRTIYESSKINANSFKAILYNRSINNIFSLWLGI